MIKTASPIGEDRGNGCVCTLCDSENANEMKTVMKIKLKLSIFTEFQQNTD